MKGIILAGGAGTRLHPLTLPISKQLLPVYDKPMIYYPISTLMLAGIREILIITTPEDCDTFKRLLGDGSQWGISFSYVIQEKPNGIATAFILGEEFLAGEPCCLILGDNIFYGSGLVDKLEDAAKLTQGARVFAYKVSDPERYGVVDFDDNFMATNIVEKPSTPQSNWAVTGIYFYDNTATDRAKKLKPSARGEYEITDLNLSYLEDKNLSVERLSRGHAWLDTGTQESLLQASNFMQTIENRQGLKVSCPEEIALYKGYINKAQFKNLANALGKSSYGEYLRDLID